MNLIFASLTLLFLQVLFAPVCLAADSVADLVASSKTKFAAKDYTGAVDSLTQAIKLDPKNSDLYEYRRMIYSKTKQWDKAVADCEKIAQFKPDAVDNVSAMTDAYTESGRYDKALVTANKAVKISPVLSTFLLRGNVYSHQSKYPEAVQDYTRAIEIFPDAQGALELRANAYNHLGKPELAQQDLMRILYSDRADKVAAADFLTDHIKAYPNLLADWNKAIAGAKGNTAASLYGRGLYKFFLGSFADATADLSAALKADSKYAPAYLARELCYVRLKKEAPGLADAEQLIALSPGNPHSYDGLDRMYFLNNQQEKLVGDLTKRMAKASNDPCLYSARGRVNLALGHLPAALADYDKAIKIKPSLSGVYCGRGQVYDAQKEYDKAIADFNLAMKADPADYEATYFRAACYQKKGDADKAVADLTTLIGKKYKLLKMYQARAQCYRRMGKADLASSDMKNRDALAL